MPIVLEHNEGKVTKVFGLQADQSAYLGRPVLSVLLALAKEFPESILGWVRQEYSTIFQIDHLAKLLRHPRELISYAPDGLQYLGPEIAYIEDSPFVCVDGSVRYPTWQTSSAAGAMHASLLSTAAALAEGAKEFDYFLNSFAKLGQAEGVLCYSEPRLLHGLSEGLGSSKNQASTATLFKFVKQHYKGRWTLLLFLNLWVYERRIALLPLFKSLFYQAKQGKHLHLPATGLEKITYGGSVDVLIPTIGRAKYLKDVLLDIAQQDLLPARVLIMEQTPKPGMPSELDFLEREWPFEIVHQVLHPPGACRSRNAGLDQIRSEWVFLADDDIRLPKDFLSKAVSFVRTWQIQAATFSCLQEGEAEVQQQVIQWTTFASGCSLVESAALQKIRFDPALEFGYGEDKDYGMQLRKQGTDVLYNPHIRVLHLKAPVGGFRYKVEKPWEQVPIVPKPSPTVLHYKLKHSSPRQLKGYKMTLFIKYYKDQDIRNPFRYYKRFKQQWRSSVAWAEKLKSN